jgi:hypothetical protein
MSNDINGNPFQHQKKGKKKRKTKKNEKSGGEAGQIQA